MHSIGILITIYLYIAHILYNFIWLNIPDHHESDTFCLKSEPIKSVIRAYPSSIVIFTIPINNTITVAEVHTKRFAVYRRTYAGVQLQCSLTIPLRNVTLQIRQV